MYAASLEDSMTDPTGFSLHAVLLDTGSPGIELHHTHACGVVDAFSYPGHTLDEVLATARLHLRDCPEAPRG